MGLPISVLRNAQFGDCTNGGISSKANSLTLVNVDGPFEPTEQSPAAILENHVEGALRIRLVSYNPETRHWVRDGRLGQPMFGGNYGASSDSRFGRACEKLLGHRFYGAVAIHDRYETAEQQRRFND
jgi:hypothetical protein